MRVLLLQAPYMKLSLPDYPIPLSLQRGMAYICPGLLIQANSLIQHNVDVKVLAIKDMGDLINYINYIKQVELIGISCTSAWEYLETIHIANYAKKINPSVKIVVGGWQARNVNKYMFKDSKSIDIIDISDSDDSIWHILSTGRHKDDYPLIISKYNYPCETTISSGNYDFSVYPNYENLLPFVEESRGCPHNCSFCLNTTCGICYKTKPEKAFESDIENIKKFYPAKKDAVLLSANFGIVPSRTIDKLNILSKYDFLWNLEMHIDNPWEQYIDLLYTAGVRKVSLGLESGSLRTLSIMKKTRKPMEYLHRAEELLASLTRIGIKTKVNILIHYKDTPNTIHETCQFLYRNSSIINRVQFNHMYYFYGLSSTGIPGKEILAYIVNSEFNDMLHVAPVIPSNYNIGKLISFFDVFEYSYNNRGDT